MALKSSPDHYGTTAVSIHWISVVLILILIGSGFRAANTVDLAAKAAILRLDAPIAVAVLALTILRIVWWWAFDRKPEAVAGSPRWQERAARAAHALFYVVILGMIASGVGMIALSGAAPIIFGGEGALPPDFWKYPPRVAHGVGARLLLALLALHVGAALYHHFVRRDGLLWRMWFSKPPTARSADDATLMEKGKNRDQGDPSAMKGPKKMRAIFNVLTISGSGMFAGVMLGIGVILGGYWKSVPPEAFLDWFSQNNHFIMRAIPLVVIPTANRLVGSLWLGWSDGTARTLWLLSFACFLAIILVTAAYYVPVNAQFAAKSIPPDQVRAKLDTWLLIHNVRIALAGIASVLGVLALK